MSQGSFFEVESCLRTVPCLTVRGEGERGGGGGLNSILNEVNDKGH